MCQCIYMSMFVQRQMTFPQAVISVVGTPALQGGAWPGGSNDFEA